MQQLADFYKVQCQYCKYENVACLGVIRRYWLPWQRPVISWPSTFNYHSVVAKQL